MSLRTFEGLQWHTGWRFTLEPIESGGYLLTHLERSELHSPKYAAEARAEAEATEWPCEFREERWLTEWLKARLVREVTS